MSPLLGQRAWNASLGRAGGGDRWKALTSWRCSWPPFVCLPRFVCSTRLDTGTPLVPGRSSLRCFDIRESLDSVQLCKPSEEPPHPLELKPGLCLMFALPNIFLPHSVSVSVSLSCFLKTGQTPFKPGWWRVIFNKGDSVVYLCLCAREELYLQYDMRTQGAKFGMPLPRS